MLDDGARRVKMYFDALPFVAEVREGLDVSSRSERASATGNVQNDEVALPRSNHRMRHLIARDRSERL